MTRDGVELSGTQNPELTFNIGDTVKFNVSWDYPGHPFWLMWPPDNTNMESLKVNVVNNGTENGIIEWIVSQFRIGDGAGKYIHDRNNLYKLIGIWWIYINNFGFYIFSYIFSK